MSYFISLIVAIFFTSLSYYLSDLTLFKKLGWWQPLLIGITVVLLGAFVEKIGASMWFIILLPFLVGIIILLSFYNWNIALGLYTYSLTLVYYVVLHVLLSYIFKFDSLIPAWKLHP